jgi:hypothetical protein
MSAITKSMQQQNEDRGNSKYDDRNSKRDSTDRNTIKSRNADNRWAPEFCRQSKTQSKTKPIYQTYKKITLAES